jgi:hypothetical protein
LVCRSFTSVVIAAAFAVAAAIAPAAAQDIATPSGQTVSLYDVVLDDETRTARFRFLAPEIGASGGGRTFEDVQVDFEWLCHQAALPALASNGWEVAIVVISMSEREVIFGETAPDIVQFFEGFRVEPGACILEIF